MKKESPNYMRRFLLGMGGYVVLLWTSLLFLRQQGVENNLLAAAIALLPMMPLIFATVAIVKRIRLQDEFIRRTNLEAVLISALVTAGITFSYGLLEAVELVPAVSMIWISPFMIMVWGLANSFTIRRYQ